MGFIDKLFLEMPPLSRHGEGDELAQLLSMIGSFGLGAAFMLFGITVLFTIGLIHPPSRLRSFLNFVLGTFLILAGLSRVVDAYAFWHNYVMIRGIIKIACVFLFIISLPLIPFVLKEMSIYKQLMEVQKDLKETNKKILELKEIGEKLTNG
jgi:hypothetical protein